MYACIPASHLPLAGRNPLVILLGDEVVLVGKLVSPDDAWSVRVGFFGWVVAKVKFKFLRIP